MNNKRKFWIRVLAIALTAFMLVSTFSMAILFLLQH